MEFLKKFFDTVTDVKDTVVEKNRRTALINRLRMVIKCEEQVCSRTYAALGKYYYQHLRDAENEDTEAYCRDIDTAKQRIGSAAAHLDEIYREDAAVRGNAAEAKSDIKYEAVSAEKTAENNSAEEIAEAAETEEEATVQELVEESVPEHEESKKPEAAEKETVHETAVDGENDNLTFE